MEKEVITISITKDLKEKIDKVATKKGLSRVALIRLAVSEYLENEVE